MNWLFFVVAAVIICFACYGYKKGIVKIVFSMGSLVVSIVLSGVLTPYVSAYLHENTGLYQTVREKCGEVIGQEEDPQDETGSDAQTPRSDLETLLAQQQFPDSLKDSIERTVLEKQMESVRPAVADGIAELVISALSFMIVLTVIRIVLWAILRVLNVATKLPVIHGANQIAGLAFGILEGLLAVWVFFIFLTCILQTEFGRNCMKMIAESRLLSYLFNYNLLTLIFK